MMTAVDKKKKVLHTLGLMLVVSSTPLLQAIDTMWFFTDGGNVTRSWSLEIDLDHCFCAYPQYGNYYLWSRLWEFVGNYGTISFSARATNDISVGVSVIDPWNGTLSENFYSTLTSSSNMYEIAIGTNSNQNTEIRSGSQGDILASGVGGIPVNPSTGLAVLDFVQYQIVFYNDTDGRDTISVFTLNPLQNDNATWTKLVSYTTSFGSHAFRWISVTNLFNPVFYENVIVSSSTTLPPH